MASRNMKLLTLLAFAFVSITSPVTPLAPRAVVLEEAADLNAEYDYVIIGGGTSGLVVANRLTEDSDGGCCKPPDRPSLQY